MKKYLVLDVKSVSSDIELAQSFEQSNLITLKQRQPQLFSTWDIIKEIFYASGLSIYNIFREVVESDQIKY